jgi:hypothetical protein
MTKQIFWLRESAIDGWAPPFLYTGELPAQLQAQIENIPSNEIHLPYLERSGSLADALPLRLNVDPAGMVVLTPERGDGEYLSRYQVMLTLAAAAHGGEDAGFRLSNGDGTAIDGRESIGWRLPPIERQRRFLPVYRMVSHAFQLCLRERFPGAYFADIDRYHDTAAAWPVLLFAASAPFTSKSRHGFNYDVLDNASIDRFYRSAERRLPPVLAAVEAKLKAAGLSDIAKQYSPARSRSIVAFVKRDRNPMRSMLLAEARLFNEFFQLARTMHDLCSEKRPLRTAPKEASEFVRALHIRLRRFYANVPVLELAMPLFLAVTHALYESRSIVK